MMGRQVAGRLSSEVMAAASMVARGTVARPRPAQATDAFSLTMPASTAAIMSERSSVLPRHVGCHDEANRRRGGECLAGGHEGAVVTVDKMPYGVGGGDVLAHPIACEHEEADFAEVAARGSGELAIGAVLPHGGPKQV